mmetsp:Transcript_10057/g.32004  ORF Transcript_10057/g.32004 Transcript_10057/m.32004 type:complete len:306 (-) Transcript_10057:1345-2262(-)
MAGRAPTSGLVELCLLAPDGARRPAAIGALAPLEVLARAVGDVEGTVLHEGGLHGILAVKPPRRHTVAAAALCKVRPVPHNARVGHVGHGTPPLLIRHAERHVPLVADGRPVGVALQVVAALHQLLVDSGHALTLILLAEPGVDEGRAMLRAIPLVGDAVRPEQSTKLHHVLIRLVRIASAARSVLIGAANEVLAREAGHEGAVGSHADLLLKSAGGGKGPARAALALAWRDLPASCARVVVVEVPGIGHRDALGFHRLDQRAGLRPDHGVVRGGPQRHHCTVEVVAIDGLGALPDAVGLLCRRT